MFGMVPRLIVAVSALCALSFAQNADWDAPYPPHRLADNVYYVGTKGLSTYLITTSAGHIVINSSFERTVPMIRASIEKLGFKFSDVKILLGSHAHNDHMEGNALFKELTGAKTYVMEGDDQIVAKGNARGWKPSKVDQVLKDGDKVTLGNFTLTAVLTPGHTKGCTTWTFPVTDGGKPFNAVIVGSPNVNRGYILVGNTNYPEISEDFARTFKTLKALKGELFLGAHGDYYGMVAKYDRIAKGEKTNPFIDPAGYKAYIEEREQAYLTELEKQRQAKK